MRKILRSTLSALERRRTDEAQARRRMYRAPTLRQWE